MKKYLNYQHLFFCVHMIFLLALGLLLAAYDPVLGSANATICILTMVISNQVIFAYKSTNADLCLPNGHNELEVPNQGLAHWLILASAIAQFHFPWSFDLRGILNYPGLMTSIFLIYVLISAHQISVIEDVYDPSHA